MPFNAASLKNITGHTTFRGVSHHARGDIKEEPIQPRENFRIQDGRNKKIVSQLGYRISVPIVAPMANIISILQSFQNARFGRPLGPQMMRVESLNTGTEVITITAHGLTTEDEVMVTWDEVAPTLNSGSLSSSTIYYAKALTANTISLHPTALDATNNTAAVNFSAAGTGDWWICAQRSLILHRNTGVKRTYRNVVVEKLPTIVAGGGKLLMQGDLVFRALPGWGYSPDGTDTAPFFVEAPAAYTPPAWSSSAELTGPALTEAGWGAAPFAVIRSEGGWQFEFTPQLSEVDDGIWPAATLALDDFTVTAKGRPIGLTKPQYDAAMAKDLGDLVTGDNLEITFAGYQLTLYEAILEPAATVFSPTNRMVSELTWMAHGDTGTDMAPPFDITTA